MSSGNSNISYLQQIRNGVAFLETFENSNFMAADGWTLLQGTPANSTAQAIAGISSWDNSANNQSVPVAQKVIVDNNVDVPVSLQRPGWSVQCWFYDTLNTTAPGPYFKIKLSDGTYLSVGVRNSASTTYYCTVSSATSGNDAPSYVTASTRTTGWHCFFLTIFGNPGSESIQVAIDSTSFTNVSVTTGATVSSMYLCADTVGGVGPSFGYFDQVAYYRNQKIGFYFSPSVSNGVAKIYDANNNLLDTLSVNATGYSIALLPAYTVVFPLTAYMEWPDTTGKNLLLRTPSMQLNPGDIYQFQSFQFCPSVDGLNSTPTKITDLQYTPAGLISRNVSTGGVQETNQTALKDQLTFTHSHLQGWGIRETIDNWFWWTAQGNPFSLMVDNVNGNAFGVIGGFIKGGTSKRVAIMNNLDTNPTDAFTVGFRYVIRQNQNAFKQEVTLSAKDTNTLTFDNYLYQDVNALDYVYSQRFFPFLEIADISLKGVQSKQGFSPPAYSWTQDCLEFNG